MNPIRNVSSLLLLAMICLSSNALAGNATMLEFTSQEDLIDTSKNPGCGVKENSDEKKTARNIRIGKFFIQSYYDLPKNSLKYSLDSYRCYAAKSTVHGGTFDPPPAVSKPRDPALDPFSGENFAKNEVEAWKKSVPDVRAQRGAARLIAWDSGAFVSYQVVGKAKTGEPIKFWEVVLMLIDDEGKITHYEFWDDTVGIGKALPVIVGKSLEEMQKLKAYSEAIESEAAEKTQR
ncbi:MAG: hypothetical protein ABW110_12000 [Steroidobacteraceae bacterium]